MKKVFALVIVFCLLAAVIPVMASGDTIVVGVSTDMTGLDPHKQTAFTSMKVLEMLHGRLVEVDENMAIQPAMAESWEWSEDGMELTMHLREKMAFSDGTPVTSEDVKFS